MDAISGQESGGDYGAENPDSGAYGRFQIMPANWPSWSAEAGIPGAPQSAANQDRVARFKMQQYYNQTGSWEDVASMWYSGQPRSEVNLTRRQGENGEYPSIGEYIDQVMGRLGGSSGGANGPVNGRAATAPGTTGSGGNTYGIYNNLSDTPSWGFGNLDDILGSVLQPGSGGSGSGTTGTTGATGESTIDRIMREYGLTREQALQMIGIDPSGANDVPVDHFNDISPGSARDFDESVLRDRRDFGYNAQQDAADRAFLEAEQKAAAAQQQFDNAMAVGDFQAAAKAAEDLNHWKQVEATQAQERNNLTNQGQQLDYNLGLGNIAADRYSTDAGIGIANMQNATDAALGQQRNQTGQFDAETARLTSERNYILGMANATTDAERVALDDRRRMDELAIANMQGNNQFTLGQQGNQVDAFNADTGRQSSNQNYWAAMANATNDAARVGIEDMSRLDKNSQFNADQTNQFTLGQQGNQSSQFGMETDRANRMGQLALENNKFIADMSDNPRDMWALYAMQRGVAPDWETIMAGGTPATGSALAPSSVMNAYNPVTAAPTFNATAAQSQAQQQAGGSYGAANNQFIQNWQGANTATSTLPQFNETFKPATGQASGGYDSSQNQFIGQQASYQPTTGAPSFNYTPQAASTPTWTGPEATSSFLPTNTNPVSGPAPTYTDTNIGGLQNGVALSGLKPGLNYSTVGGADRTGANFGIPAYYDQGMTQRVGPDDVVQGGTGIWTWYGDNLPGGGQQLIKPYNPADAPMMNMGGVTNAPQFVTGDDPNTPDGLGVNAELNEPQVGPGGRYLGTKVTPLNPARRPMGNAWGGDTLRMAAGFGIRPSTMFSKR
ncbi:MAG: hypothetical protein WC869_16150 [Phycisphaerae bacterium]|jgi:hypothetical protein